MLTLTQFSRKVGREIRYMYELAKLTPLPPLADKKPPKAGMKKLYSENDLQDWYEKAMVIKNANTAKSN